MKPKTRQRELESCLVITTGLVILYAWLGHEILLWVAIAVGVLGALWPKAGYWIDKLWYGLAHIMGTLMSYVLLTLAYGLVLVPTAMLRRLFSKKDPLQLKPPKEGTSLWKTRNHSYTADDLKNPW